MDPGKDLFGRGRVIGVCLFRRILFEATWEISDWTAGEEGGGHDRADSRTWYLFILLYILVYIYIICIQAIVIDSYTLFYCIF